MVNARLNQLNARLRELSMIDMSKIPHDRVGLGSTVMVLDLDKDEKIRYKLVTSEDVDAKQRHDFHHFSRSAGACWEAGWRYRENPDSGRRSGNGDRRADHHSSTSGGQSSPMSYTQRDRLGLQQSHPADCARARAFQNPSQCAHVPGPGDQYWRGLSAGRRPVPLGGRGHHRRGIVRHGGRPRRPRNQPRHALWRILRFRAGPLFRSARC